MSLSRMVEIPRPFDRAQGMLQAECEFVMPVHGIQVRFKFENRLYSGSCQNDKTRFDYSHVPHLQRYPITRCRDTKRNRKGPISAIGTSRELDSF